MSKSTDLANSVNPDSIEGSRLEDGGVTNAKINASAAIDSSKSSYLAQGVGAIARAVNLKLGEIVSVKDFGAQGNDSSNDTAAIQAAIDSLGANGGTVYFPPGVYRIARTVGVNDRWGLKITGNNVTLLGSGATLRRFDTNISTYALAYPLVFVGTPDSNSAPATKNFRAEGLIFRGEDTRHSIVGNVANDYRTAIYFKNTDGTAVHQCNFTYIDSQALYYQLPRDYSYVNNVFFNTTKNYRTRVTNCNFIAQPHTVVGRALLHALSWGSVDHALLDSCYFEWCDDCVAGEGTYNRPTDSENDTWLPTVAGWTLGPVKRGGRDWTCTNNQVYNSSEHAFYPGGMDVMISNNQIWTDQPDICKGDQIKIRSKNVTVTGNIISNYYAGVTVNEPSYNVSITGNTMNIVGPTYTGGAFDINSDDLSSYINNRSNYLTTYDPMANIVFDSNVVVMDPATQSASGSQGSAVRIYTATTDPNFPEGQIVGVRISNNVFKNHNLGVFLIGALMRAVDVTGNTFQAKNFTTAGFNAGTTLNTHSVITAYAGADISTLRHITFNNNRVWGATYLVATHTGGGGASTYELPVGMVGNSLNYIKNLKGPDVQPLTARTRFVDNAGSFFLDRAWNGYGLENSLSASVGGNSALRYITEYDGTNLRFYTDDSGSSIILG